MSLTKALILVALLVGGSLTPAHAAPAASAAPSTAMPVPTAAPSTTAAPLPSATPIPSPAPSGSPASTRPAVPAESRAGNVFIQFGGPQQGLTPYARFIDGATAQNGLFTVWRKQGRVFLEIAPDQLDRPYLLVPMLSSGLGKGLFSGLHLRPVLWKFHRTDDGISSIEANPYVKATAGTAAAAAVANSFPDSIISTDPIVAVNSENGHLVFPADALFGDIGYLSDVLQLLSDNPFAPRYGINRGLSSWGPTKAFPNNVDLEVDLTLAGQGGTTDTVPDPRSLYVRLHYSIMELPHDGFQPRYADDRIGYFITARRQFDSYDNPDNFVRYIDRWNIQKADPRARVSRAKQPIVFYLLNDIPPRYRPAIRHALLTWNSAFEKIGITDAIEVRQQPNDPNWDPDDVRYSVVRWIFSTEPLFGAAAPIVVNPLNGQILRADLIIDGSAVTNGASIQSQIVDPTRAFSAAQRLACSQYDCAYEEEMSEQQQWAALALTDAAVIHDPRHVPQWFVDQYLTEVVLHESGHCLGLRHNFEASTLYARAQLHDARFTRNHGLSASVMDYVPVNISPHGQPQGDYFQTQLGPWDYFTVRYGYEPLRASSPEGELPELRRLASQTTQPELAYATDEDDSWENGFATDPRVNQWDLSSDPLGYTADALSIDQRLFETLPQRLPKTGESYAEERYAFAVLLHHWWGVSRVATHYIGGEYFTRNHRGDPHARLPFTPVPRSEERRAFALLDRYVFGDDAFQFSPTLINGLGDDRFYHWQSNPNELGRLDFPVDEFVETYQLVLLAQVWQPSVLARLAALESRVSRPSDTMSLADLYDWTDQSMWGDLQRRDLHTIPRAHRALQHFYTELLVHLMLKPDPGSPSDARALARYHLSSLRDRIDVALARNRYDETTTANLLDIRTLVDRSLNAAVTLPSW